MNFNEEDEMCNTNIDKHSLSPKRKNYYNLEEIEGVKEDSKHRSSTELVPISTKPDNAIQSVQLSERKVKASTLKSPYKSPCIKKLTFEVESPHLDLKVCEIDINIAESNEIEEKLKINDAPFKETAIPFSVNEFNHFEYIMDEKDRRLNTNDLEKGKNFFKYRYISQNLNSQYIKSSIYSNSISKTTMTHAPDDKLVIKYKALFLQKLEKAIFLFNLRKYEDSYKYLIDSKIIFDNEEFAEMLLVFKGYDKYNIGEFLSKEKIPNTGYVVLQSYMKKINFAGKGFLISLRFLLSKLNLPKDSILILRILDEFSKTFYEDNKEIYQDSDSLYLLASCIMAINTLFHRDDIDNVKQIKKEDFVKMNIKVPKQIVELIYDEIKLKKLDIIYDYNELIYKRLSVKVDVETNILTDREVSREISTFSIDQRGEFLLTLLRQGEIFTKYGNKGNPHPRFVKLVDNDTKIVWKQLNVCSLFRKRKYIEVSQISDVYIGSSNTDIFQKFKIPEEFDQCCISIVSSKRSLDLRKDDDHTSKNWYQAIKYLIAKVKSLEVFNNKKIFQEMNNISEIISQIWKNEILPYWKVYRKYLKLGSSFKNDLYTIIKKRQSIFEKLRTKFTLYNSEIKILEDNKIDFIFIWNLGIPSFVRSRIWQILIQDQLNFSENLFNYFLNICENFDDNAKTLNCNKSSVTKDEVLISSITHDVIKTYSKFKKEISDILCDEKEFKVILIK
jgi:hypothetical protein